MPRNRSRMPVVTFLRLGCYIGPNGAFGAFCEVLEVVLLVTLVRAIQKYDSPSARCTNSYYTVFSVETEGRSTEKH